MRRAQLSFGDGLIAAEVDDLCEDWMKHADQVLADELLVAAVYEALAKRRPKSRSRGRQGTPAEVVLRLLILKHNPQLELSGAGARSACQPGGPKPSAVGAWLSGRRTEAGLTIIFVGRHGGLGQRHSAACCRPLASGKAKGPPASVGRLGQNSPQHIGPSPYSPLNQGWGLLFMDSHRMLAPRSFLRPWCVVEIPGGFPCR
jgi:hypothetical protein